MNQQEWIDLRDAHSVLGRGYSRASIYRKIDLGEFQEGVHYARAGRFIKINITLVQAEW